MDVGPWLRGLDLGQYEAAFREHAVDAAILPSLTADDLKDLGVSRVGHRRKLLQAIAELRRAPAGTATGLSGAAKVALQPVANVGERRQVSVLFADLAGYTRLSTELDPEEVHAVLSAFFEAADGIVAAHGGTIDKHIGDCVMAVFGAPVAHGNDAERAAYAALAIRDAMPGLATGLARPIGIHVGIASGEVVASDVGGTEHRAYTVTGESVNLAARLTAAAKPGEILISASLRNSLNVRMDCAEPRELTAKGFAETVRAWCLVGPKRAAPPDETRPFVGRERERRQCVAILDACLEAGRGRPIHIRGEAGIGKTRLVEELRRDATALGFDCHSALVLDFGAGAGRDAVGSLVGGLLELQPNATNDEARRALDVAMAAGLASADDALFLHDLLDLPLPSELLALAHAMDSTARARGARETTRRQIERACADRPVLFVVEDVHWADDTTLQNLSALAGVTESCRAILVTTSRFEGDPLSSGRMASATALTLDLAALGDDAALALAEILLRDESRALMTRCVERAAGNPLFLEQLLRHAEEQAGADSVPDTVQSLVQARLDRLDPSLKQALQAATIFGQRFSLDGLRFLLGGAPCDAGALTTHHLVRSVADELLFAHALIRDAVYATLLRRRRRELHCRAATWFAGRGDLILRAEHLDQADDPAAPAAYLDAATAQAALYRYESALAQVERGLVLAREPGLAFVLACQRGDLLHDLGRIAEARDAYETALAAARADAERCRARLGLAAVKRIADDLDGAFDDLRQAEEMTARLGLATEAARVHFLRGNLLFPRGDIAGCLREHQASLELSRKAGSVELEAAALGGLGDAEYMSGRMLSAHGWFRDCVALSRHHGFGRIEVANRPMEAFTCWFAGDTRKALVDAEAAITAARRVAHHRAEMIGHHSAYFCQHSLLDLAAARDHADAALALSRRLGARRFDAEALAFQADLHRLSGRREEAVGAAEEAVRISEETGAAFLGPFTLGVLALATTDSTVREEALAKAEAILQAGAVSHNHLLFRRDAIDVCLEDGRWEQAEHHAAALEAFASREPSPWAAYVAGRGRLLAAFGRGERSAGLNRRLAALRGEAARLGLLASLSALDTVGVRQ